MPRSAWQLAEPRLKVPAGRSHYRIVGLALPNTGARDRCGRSEMAPGQAHGEDRCSARCCRVPAREHLRRAGIRDRSLEPLVGVFRPAGDHQSRETMQLRVKKVAFLRSWHWPSPLEVPSEGTHHRKGRTLLRPGTESSNPSPSSAESTNHGSWRPTSRSPIGVKVQRFASHSRSKSIGGNRIGTAACRRVPEVKS